MSKQRLGIYGGTFSPPHLGHLRAAESFISGAELDRLLIMPDGTPPHKTEYGNATAEDRLNMCRIAFSSLPKTEISDFEMLRGGKSYTYLTLEAFSSPDTDLYFLCGTDMFLTLGNWRCPEIIFNLATICFVRREDDRANDALIEEKISEYRERFSARILEISHSAFEVSSSELRTEIRNDTKVSAALDDGVSEYIRERGLYK